MKKNKVFLSDLSEKRELAIGQEVAERLGVPFIDLTAEVAKRAAIPAADLAVRRCDRAIWAIESELVASLVARPEACVVALAEETILERSVRRCLLNAGLVVTLESHNGVPKRPGSLPPIAPNPIGPRTWPEQLFEREIAYAECHAELNTTNKSAQEVAQQIVQLLEDEPVVVPLGERTYRIYIGSGVRARLADLVNEYSGRNSVAVVVTDQGVRDRWGAEARDRLTQKGRKSVLICLPAGESAKHLGSVETIWNSALEGEVDRNSIVVGIGGGVVGDLSGFAAATLLRGIALGHVPTTLLAMVDSAIGGKTGFDTRHGKNLIGAFYQPRFVLTDIDTLNTLPLQEVRAGLAEVVKSAWLDGETAVAELERDAAALIARDIRATVRAIRMAAGLKARIVTEDERESDRRQLLNLGHTVGHAIEASLGYQGMRHGEAVSLGMVAAFRLGIALGRASRSQSERLEKLLATLGLPTDVSAYLSERTLSFMGTDKKRRASKINFVVPSDPGRVEVVPIELTEIIQVLSKGT